MGHDNVALDALLEKVHREGGYDFREYKRGTVMRRLGRMLHASGTETYMSYMDFLDDNHEEYHRLARDITIKASGFFRNQWAFQQLWKLVFPELISRKWKQGERKLRFWSTACAGGEEPYSIAMALAQYMGPGLHDFDVTINATDIDQEALREAQAGIY